MLFTINEASVITDASPQTIRNLISSGLIRPAVVGRTGARRPHQLGLNSLLAIYAAGKYRGEQASADRAAGVMRLLDLMTIEQIEAHFAKGETFPVPSMLMGEFDWLPGTMIAPPSTSQPGVKRLLAKIDLVPMLAELKRRVAKRARTRSVAAK